MRKIFSGLILVGITSLAFADAPVVDYSSDADVSTSRSFAMKPVGRRVAPATTNLNVEQRINKLEQQINNVNEQNLSNKVEELQQQVQKLTGQLENQNHQIEQLHIQLKGFYQDLNQRLGTNMPGTSANQVATVGSVQSSVMQNANNLTSAFPNSEVAKKNNLKPANADSAFLKEQQIYQTAIDLLPDKKHESEGKLRDYLKAYPHGVYVANAHYWLGEINFLQKNFDAAEEEFKIVVDNYPKSKRVSDAYLKLALVHQNQGREAQAKQELKQITKRYPGTSAAQLAKQQLAGN